MNQQQCKRCGSCCQNGGPALHREDLSLFSSKTLRLEHCITIRQGERVISPLSESPEAAQRELIKLKGRGKKWSCLFFAESDNSCAIYANQPLECRLFKCWDPSELQDVIEADTLKRQDLLVDDHPGLEFIEQLEMECPVSRIDTLVPLLNNGKNTSEPLMELEKLVQMDLAIRRAAIERLSLTPDFELFLLGRPYFLLLAPFGITAQETTKGISLSFHPPG